MGTYAAITFGMAYAREIQRKSARDTAREIQRESPVIYGGRSDLVPGKPLMLKGGRNRYGSSGEQPGGVKKRAPSVPLQPWVDKTDLQITLAVADRTRHGRGGSYGRGLRE